jgi:hypothetical protein
MTKRAGKNRSPAGNKYRPHGTTAEGGSLNGGGADGQSRATGGQPIEAEIVAPSYTFVGPGKDTALVRKAVQDGWDVPFATRRRLVNKLTAEIHREGVSLKDTLEIGRMLVLLDKMRIEGAKLDVITRLKGLSAEPVEHVKVKRDSGEEMFQRMLDAADTPEKLEFLLSAVKQEAS